MNVRDVNDDRQTEMHTDNPLVPEIAAEKLGRYKLPGTEHTQNVSFPFIIRKNCHTVEKETRCCIYL